MQVTRSKELKIIEWLLREKKKAEAASRDLYRIAGNDDEVYRYAAIQAGRALAFQAVLDKLQKPKRPISKSPAKSKRPLRP